MVETLVPNLDIFDQNIRAKNIQWYLGQISTSIRSNFHKFEKETSDYNTTTSTAMQF